MPVDMVIPVKGLLHGKSRLRDSLGPDVATHAELVLSLALDTVAAVTATEQVRRVLVVTSDPVITDAVHGAGAETLAEGPRQDLNLAVRHGFAALRGRRRDPALAVGALQADLPALRPSDLGAAITEAAGRRAYCADRAGTGTTLLLAAVDAALDPAFGPGSAAAHAATGALALRGPLPSLRCDVDTAADLTVARDLGLGRRTTSLVGEPCW